MLGSRTVWLVPIALSLVEFGSSAVPASAQTTYSFSANYDILATASDITPNLAQIFLSGSSTNALFGLTQVNSLSYSQTDFATGLFTLNSDPVAFGLQGLPIGSVVFSGSSNDKLFGTSNATGVIDFATLTVKSSGTVTVTGGEGRFRGATGTLATSQIQPFSLDLGVALQGQAVVSGFFQTQMKSSMGILCSSAIAEAISSGIVVAELVHWENFLAGMPVSSCSWTGLAYRSCCAEIIALWVR